MTRMAETTVAALGPIQIVHFDDLHHRHRYDEHLGDAHPALDDEFFAPEVDQRHLDLAAVVGVDGSGRVDHGDAVPAGQAAAGADLRLVSVRAGHEETA